MAFSTRQENQIIFIFRGRFGSKKRVANKLVGLFILGQPHFIFKMVKFSEFELLTLREGLFFIRKNKDIMTEGEFKQIDNKIKIMVEGLK